MSRNFHERANFAMMTPFSQPGFGSSDLGWKMLSISPWLAQASATTASLFRSLASQSKLVSCELTKPCAFRVSSHLQVVCSLHDISMSRGI